MGSKNKLKRFNENETFDNVIQPTREEMTTAFEWKGKWATFFKNDNPITLELGCGKGEYTIDLARKYPNRNFIGVDIKGARFWRGAKTAIEEGLTNVAFLRTQIELVEYAFGKNEIDEIWITFPDPQIKYKRTKHRMTNPEFLSKYKNILVEGGFINLKTDSEFMHGYTLGLLQGLGEDIVFAHHDIYTHTEAPEEVVSTQTFYEKQYLEQGKAITYLKFRLR
ncbi:tRNA (guanosine(46)-N7)-methyltransferase TrmB [Nonlabens ulvanivorans]|uniref:tRNA (guanine-N(7)-)-methyltransferase n=2 Tax=Nonlabens ulvanivorans TaxID=906888 RepID=A0A084JUX9_NONUL|nr:tRNA (guanosine(46)-N7)-methyltransferase TrmB [Nonlabens ulvanivorans]KEZ92763.1 tRNA (guanine-N7)-methyltransferase [Nonlabens ulvanivorans]PRX15612.1 tRNA (guanine-N(7)-)-methyltransferase [Nonlabens ulvanivorans]WOI22049.1 tRNA (guanosine(46)-N7)-methyltransferase TrmB [Nonlabens ulvanivorans]